MAGASECAPRRAIKAGRRSGFPIVNLLGFQALPSDETPIEIEERIAFEVALAINQERERIRSAIEARSKEALAASKARMEAAEEKLKETLKLTCENRTQLVKRRMHGRPYGFRLSSGYKATRYRGTATETRRGKKSHYCLTAQGLPAYPEACPSLIFRHFEHVVARWGAVSISRTAVMRQISRVRPRSR
jgi:hypothetical protein